MRAMIYRRYGEPREVLELAELPMPKVAPGEVLVRVRSAAVNPVDWKLMAGGLDGMLETFFPVVPGWDLSGVVESVGYDTPEFQPGDEVIAYARKDVVHDGTFGEFISVPARSVACKPARADWTQAAGLPLAGLTAQRLLHRLYVGPGDTVLIHAAAGGVGSFACQLAVADGAQVLGTASEHNFEYLRGLGVEPLDYSDDVVAKVRELVPGGVDAVADFHGDVLDITQEVLRSGGRHGSIADPSVEEVGGSYVWVRPNGVDLQVLTDLVDAGKLTVPIAETFPLEQAADAFELSRSGHVRGKIAIEVSR